MAARPAQTRWTYSEFARLPNDGKRFEIIAGELYVSDVPSPLHQLIGGTLAAELFSFTDDIGLGWVLGRSTVLFAEGDYMEPDLVFVRRERRGIITDRGIEGPPDLIVEVISGSTADRDRGIKRERYAYFGVPLYWIVDQDARHIEVYRLQEDPARATIVRDTLTWTPFPGGPTLTIPLAEVFRGFA